MHQRVVSSRSRQPKREKIFRATKDDNNHSSEKRKIEFKQRGLLVTSNKAVPSAISTNCANISPAADNSSNITTFNNSSRVPVILCKPAFRDCRPTVTRSRSRDASSISCRNEPFRKRLDSDLLPLSHAKTSASDSLKVLDFHGAGFSDNLTKLLRCILYEEDRDRRAVSAGQLREYVLSSDFSISASSGFRIAQELTKLLLERNPQELKEDVVECVGVISIHLKDNTRRFLDWLFEKYETVPNDEYQILLLRVLLEALKHDEGDTCFAAHMPAIMSNIQCTLENTDVPTLLRAIVDVVTTISERYPEIFRDHFRDTVDILVGWHIDPTQSDTIVSYTSEALVSFHSYWVADLPFSMMLLGQFLEDVEAYSEEMTCFPVKEDDETENTASDYSAKIASLIRVYTTVVKSLGEHFEPDNNPTITVDFISENLTRLLSSVMSASAELIWTDLLIAANECVGLLAIHLGACTATHLETLLAFVQLQTSCDSDLSTPLLVSMIHLLTQVVKACGVHLPLGFVTQILGSTAMWPSLRQRNNIDLHSALTELYASVFRLRDVPLLEEAYKCILCDLKAAFLHLLDWKLDIPTPETTAVLDSDHSAIVDIIFCLRAISEVGNDKTSLIGMMALNPSVFYLLTHYLKPTDRTMGLHYPIVQYSVLSTLYSHCARHGQFACSSSLTSPNLSVTDRPTTSGHLTVIVELLTKILSEPAHCYDTRILALQWSYAVFDSLRSLLPQLCNSGPINSLLQALLAVGFGNMCDGKICTSVGQSFCLAVASAGPNLTRSVLKRCHELCLLNLSHKDNAVQSVYMELFTLLPLDRIISPLSVASGQWSPVIDSESVRGLCSLWQARRYLQSRIPSGLFRSIDFRAVMSFLLLGNHLDSETVAEIYHACRRMEKTGKPEEKLLSYLVTSHKGMLWFWATYECAFLCITAKLRTPLGKPQETFTAIELAVKSLASEAAFGHVADGKLAFPNDPLNVFSSHLRAQLLLSFLEHLEKLLYNAYEGCALSIASTPKAVKTFFRTNKATCQEWMHRVRRAAMTLALKTGHPALVIHHGYHFLAAFKDSGVAKDGEFFHSLLMVVQALVELKSPDAILGLYSWCRKRFDLRLAWIKVSVDLGAGRYEAAAHEFKAILAPFCGKKACSKDDDSVAHVLGFAGHNNKLEGHVIDYMRSQVLECYRRLGSWSELSNWLEQQRDGDATESSTPWISTVNECHLRAMASFDASCASGEIYDANSGREMQTTLCNLNSFCRQVENVLLGVQSKCNISTDGQIGSVRNKLNCFGEVLKLSTMEWPPCLPPELALLHHTALKLSRLDEDQLELKSHEFSLNVTDDMDCALLLQALRWNCGFQNQKRITSTAGGIEDLYLGVVRLARKQQNLKLCQKLLQHRSLIEAGLTGNSQTNEETWVGFRVSKTKWCQESAKLHYSLDNKGQAVKILSTTISAALANIHQNQETFSYSVKGQTVSELGSRCLMNLVKWLQIDGSLANFLPLELCGESFKLYSNGWCLNSTGNDWNVLPVTIREGHGTEEMIGRLLWLGTAQCPWLEKAWSNYAAWCYKTGKKTVDMAMESGFDLLADDRHKISDLLPKDQKEDLDIICKIISDPCNASLAMSSDSSIDQDFTDPLRLALLAVPSVDSNNVSKILVIVQGVVKRLYTLYHLAARGYFAYLKLSAGSISAFEGSEVFEEGSVTATLRLLRLMVKYATELRDVIEVGLSQTPTKPWRGIIPQLFSRLHHPEPYVRQSISDLLCRVAIDAPHLIIFPAVVGSSAPRIEPKETSGLLGECLSQQSDDELEDKCDCEDPNQYGDILLVAAEEENQQKATILQNCFASMVDTLSKEEPRSVSEVQKMVHELRRITLLWDEFWVGTLGQYQADFNRRVAQLEKEVQKVKANPTLAPSAKSVLILKKHQTFLKPMIYVMEQLQQVTNQQPETQHEQWFRDTFGPLIEDVLFKLKNPVNPELPQASWQIFRQLHHALQQGVQRRSGLLLNMNQISPVLSSMKASMIAMPGAVMRPGQIITIHSIENNIAVLPTKTKPKKLVFVGSDGKRYTFLFKGLEDLHLDERIMQLLMIINGMFAKLLKKGHANFSARHYAVTPLGLRSGLIQWVDGATPLFGLYKRWQQREVVAQALRSASTGANVNPAQGALLRPSEIYYNKLAPLLKERGITNFENRKEWPLLIQRKVLAELMAETPNDLLARELWAASTSAAEWWSMTQRYAQSTAVMSVIGYIIGLGDRHLDNVLVDLATGEVVHIDYNVCFEKGRNLRVPEKVPFRMTPNIEMALGVTGVEGAFRVSCERVLKMLRHGRETLLTLLEAFVYDPLIDWTPGNEGGYTGAVYGGWQGGVGMAVKRSRHDMEKEVTVEMLHIRMAEMRSQWLENREELLTVLPDLECQLQTWIDAQQHLLVTEDDLQEFHQQMAFLKEAEANAAHPLHSLDQRYRQYLVVQKQLQVVRASVEAKLAESQSKHQMHKNALDAVKGPELSHWCHETRKGCTPNALTYPPAVEFLYSAGQSQLLQQCEQSEKDLALLVRQLQGLLQSSLEALTKYATIISQYPPSYSNESRIFHWVNWLSEISSDFSLLKCQEIVGAFHARYGNNSIDINVSRNSVNIVSKLQAVIATHNAKIVSLCERLRVEGLEMNMLRSKCSFYGTEDILVQLKNFVAEHKHMGVKSLACALTGYLASLANRLEKMESAAAAAGDRLADMTSMDGDWFLDEVYTLSFTICELSSLFGHYPEVLGNDVVVAAKLVSSSHQVVSALQELHVHFRNIILPEAMKGLQTDDASVVQATDDLLTLVKNVGSPLNVVISQLEAQIRCVVMEMEIPHKELGAKLKNLRAQFDALHDIAVEPADLSPGQMLLLGFNGLFTKLELEFLELVSQSKLLPVPPSWRKVDVIREARKLLAPVFLDKSCKLLVDVFFVKRLQTMCEVFTLIKTHCTFLKGCHTATDVRNSTSICSNDFIARPVQVFISEFVNKMLLGLPMQTLGQCICIGIESCGLDVTAEIELKDVGATHKVAVEDLCRKAVELGLRSGLFQQHQLAQVSTVLSSLETMCKGNDLTRRLERNLLMHKASMQKAQLQLASYQWLNEDILSQSSLSDSPSTLISPTRSSVMSELKKNMQSLISAEPGIGQARERYLSLVNSVEQRLRWAAGANPSVGATLEEFEQLASSVNQLVVGLMKLNGDVASNCESILHFEALRTRTAEALSSDYGFLQLLNICQECCLLTENCTSVVTPLEEKLLVLMPLEKSTVCPEWITSVSNKIADAVGSVQLEVTKRKTVLNATSETIKDLIIKVRSCLSTHHRMMTEIRAILRSLAKYEEQEGEKYNNGVNVRQYLISYRVYSEQFTQLVKEILVDELTLDSAHSYLYSVSSLQDSTKFIYDELIALCTGLDAKATNTLGAMLIKDDVSSNGDNVGKDGEIRSNHLVVSDNGEHFLSGTSPGSQVLSAKSSKAAAVVGKKKVLAKEAFSGVAEERNLYAVGVWKRVKMKLDGRDPDPNKRSSVPEQVEYIILEATNPDNLATLYEGWTPWV